MLPESRWKNNSKNHTSDTKCAESVELSANAAWQIPHFLFQKGVHKNSLISDSAPEAQTARARPTTTMSELTAHQSTPFEVEVGQVKTHLELKLSAAEIARRVERADGKRTFGETAIRNCIEKLEENPSWRGERAPGSARPRKTTPKQDRFD